jgi:hypothetical protein
VDSGIPELANLKPDRCCSDLLQLGLPLWVVTKFREQDYKLEEQILAVNSEIKKLNKENHQEAPEFNSDLYRTSNRQKKTYAGNPSSSRHGETKSRRLVTLLFGDRVSSNCCICL